MKAISIWQPWATAIALGHKRIETRSWSTNHRGPIAIHAGKHWDDEQRRFANSERIAGRIPRQLALGAIVATAMLVDVKRTEDLIDLISPIERIYGDYSPGRFGWILERITPLREPIGCTGRQGFFEYPEELLL